ncbi:MAG: GTPase ObgE [Acutalibacteraceae bacterium]|nr:GTPase ObgE [Acutalibacteraceae bacterium]
MFVDIAKIKITAGDGGNGAVAFRREKYVAAGGPDGGDGGRGGNVVFKVNDNLSTLADFRYKRKYKAPNGAPGQSGHKSGKKGEDLIIEVPRGTIIREQTTGKVMADMSDDDEFIAAKGGRGGWGNSHFKTPTRQTPRFAKPGTPGESWDVSLELKLLADVGLLGFPNVGKSTLLSVATSAKPKIANYHFTTIDPNLGVVNIHDKSFVMADIAGIIEGAHMGFGLGIRFLKHIERTKMLIHVIDVSGSEGRDPIEDYKKINAELEQYDPALLKKPQIIAANKIDLVEDEEALDAFMDFMKKEGRDVFPISAATRQGVEELLNETLNRIVNYIPPEEDEIELFDFEKDEYDADYKKLEAFVAEDGAYELTGGQLLKIFRSTNFTDVGSMRYLYRYIVNKGGIDMLKELGLQEGDTVRIEDYEFEYYDD